MSENNRTNEAAMLLEDVKLFKNLTWLGILLPILAIIFGCISMSKANKVSLCSPTKTEMILAASLKRSAMHIMIGIICAYVFIPIIIACFTFVI